MTVAELIAKLQTMPQDLPVYLADWNEGYVADYELCESAVNVNPEEVTGTHNTVSPHRVLLG